MRFLESGHIYIYRCVVLTMLVRFRYGFDEGKIFEVASR